MVRLIRIAAGVLSLFLLSAGTVRAQGWGWEGWGGWTNTPEGALAQGMGHFYKGAGIFNERTAIADSINADTMMRWNDYISAANQEGASRYVARRRENSANNRLQNDRIVSRIRDNPTADIEMGDAINAAINQLTDPRVSSAALRLATAPIDASVIQDIAFRNASEGVTIVLSQIRAVTKWPSALELERFADQKKDFESIVEKAIKEDEEGEISSDTLKNAHTLVSVIRGKLAAEPLEGAKARDDATRFVKTLAGVIRLLERPDTTEAFNQLRTVKTTHLGNLIAFMEIYNLRFGQATTPDNGRSTATFSRRSTWFVDQVVKGVSREDNSGILSNLNPVFDFFGQLFGG